MPTIKQKKAIERVMENRGNVSRSMIEAGYDETTAKNPKNLTDSKAWKELMEKTLPDEKLVKVHEEGLKATTKRPHMIDRDDKGRPVYEYISEADYSTRHKYLDLAYKIKGKTKEDEVPEQPRTININFFNDPRAQELVKNYEEGIKKILQTNGTPRSL